MNLGSRGSSQLLSSSNHDDVIKWRHFPRYWPFVRGINRSPVNSPHKSQWRGVFMFSLICVWPNGWISNGEAGDLRRHRAHYDVTVMIELGYVCACGCPLHVTSNLFNNLFRLKRNIKALHRIHQWPVYPQNGQYCGNVFLSSLFLNARLYCKCWKHNAMTKRCEPFLWNICGVSKNDGPITLFEDIMGIGRCVLWLNGR